MNKIISRGFAGLVLLLLAGCAAGGDSHDGEDGHGHGHGHGHEHGHGHGEAGEGESMEVELTGAQMEAVGIRLGTLERREMGETLQASGMLEIDPGNEGVASPRVSGTVSRICVKAGERVRAGQTVAYVNSPELLSMRQDYAMALREVETVRREFERQEALARQGAGVRKNLDNARAELTRAEMTAQNWAARIGNCGASPEGNGATVAVKADISGTVTAVEAEIGSYADPQIPMVRIANTDAVFCRLRVLEKDIDRIRPGMEVEMRLTNSPVRTFTGTVADVTPVIDPQNRTVPVRVALSKGEGTLIPGMAVSASVGLGGEKTDVLPEEAVVSEGGRKYVFVLEDEHMEDGQKTFHFEKREVVTSTASGGYISVTPLEPISPDTRIVTRGAFFLNSMSTEHGEHSH